MIGKYIDLALKHAKMSRAELARRAGVADSTITRVSQEKRTVKRETLLHWCEIMQCPPWLQTLILNAADYASQEQEQVARAPETIEQAQRRIQEESRNVN